MPWNPFHRAPQLSKLAQRAATRGQQLRAMHEAADLPLLSGKKLLYEAQDYATRDWRGHMLDDRSYGDDLEFLTYFVLGYTRTQLVLEPLGLPSWGEIKDIPLRELLTPLHSEEGGEDW